MSAGWLNTTCLLAAPNPREAVFQTFWGIVLLGGLFLVGAVIIYYTAKWRKASASEACIPSDQLAHFRELHRTGAISKEEYEQIKARLHGELRRHLGPTPNAEPSMEIRPEDLLPPDGITRPPDGFTQPPNGTPPG
jgi:hypothetical protein